MQKRLVGQNHSYVFEFVEPEESENAEDFGLVFRGKCEQDGTPVIVRYLRNKQLIKSPQHLQLVQNIFLSFNKLDEGLVKTFDCIVDENGLYIIREHLQGIDLQQVIFTGDYPHLRNTKFFLTVAEKVCKTLETLHHNKIIHRRIQPNTIFLVANNAGQIDIENPTVKLLNLEYAQINSQNILGFTSTPYSLYYSAPELVLQANPLINASCDLYSLGITLFEAFAREHAFICENDDKNLILNMQLSFPLKPHHRVDKSIFEMLQKATAKHIFKTPPMRYKPEARLKFFYNAQKLRFQSANEMSQCIATLIQEYQVKQEKSLVQKLKNIFKR